MFATDINTRVLRSGSQTRSEPGAKTPRPGRGRTSRRPSPALSAVAPPSDSAELGTSKQSYGTENQLADMQLQGAALGRRRAVDSIANAVANAESGLSTVPEGVEGELAGPPQVAAQDIQPVPDVPRRLAVQDVQPVRSSLLSRITSFFWGPRIQQVDDRNTIYNGRRVSDAGDAPAIKWSGVMTAVLAVFLVLFISYNFAAVANYASDLKDYLPVAAGNSTPSAVTAHDYKLLKRRLDVVEQHLHDLPTFPAPSDNTPQQINWFTPGFGAIIDVGLSSPTTTFCDPTWKPWPITKFFNSKCPELPVSPPHKMALQSWDDPTLDRWCAPRSGGKLQLAIELQRPILPTELVVEYMSKQSSPEGYMSTAPKEFELWIRVEDDDVRGKINEAIDRLHPELWEDSSSQGKSLVVARDLGAEYVPVGRWMYNIHAPSHIQGFKMAAPLLEFGVKTTKVAIRVNSNWGNVDFTCINRFRLHAVDVSGYEEELEVEG